MYSKMCQNGYGTVNCTLASSLGNVLKAHFEHKLSTTVGIKHMNIVSDCTE